jgi:hypothetical protein
MRHQTSQKKIIMNKNFISDLVLFKRRNNIGNNFINIF